MLSKHAQPSHSPLSIHTHTKKPYFYVLGCRLESDSCQSCETLLGSFQHHTCHSALYSMAGIKCGQKAVFYHSNFTSHASLLSSILHSVDFLPNPSRDAGLRRHSTLKVSAAAFHYSNSKQLGMEHTGIGEAAR